MTLLRALKAAALASLLAVTTVHAAVWHKPPKAPVSGYGSPESYLTQQVIETVRGRGDDGSRVWIYEPGVLKAGDKAPVVIFLHGFAALKPYIYRSHIAHLVKQGNIVIFPQFQISEGPGVLAESGLKGVVDQAQWVRRAVAATQEALAVLDSKADPDQRYLYSHSLGGLIASAWEHYGGPAPVRYVLAHPAFDGQAGQPAFVQALVKIKPIPWQETSRAITAPVTILHGEDDKVAPLAQSEAFVAQLQTQGVPFAVYKALRDTYGSPNLSPNHGAPCDKIHPIPSNLKLAGISFELNALDYRYYFAGLDAILAGQGDGPLPFEMGTWSNGRAVKAPQLYLFSP